MNTVKPHTSLVRKVTVSVGLIFVLLLALILLASKTIVLTGFEKLEVQDVETNITRLQHSIDRELDNLKAICGDWAPWDDARDFMKGIDPNFPQTDLTIECVSNLKLNFMMYVDNDGKIFHTSAADYAEETEVNLPAGLAELILSEKKLLTIAEPQDCQTGILIFNGLPVLIAAQPISDNSYNKPTHGTFIIGRYFDENVLAGLRKQTCLEIAFTDRKIEELSPTQNFVEVVDKNIIAGYTNRYDISGVNYVTLRVDIPRKIYHYGNITIHYFIFIMALVALLILGCLLYILQAIVLKPLKRLTSNLKELDKNESISTKLYTERNDEIGSLARSFDSLMEHLKQRMKELAEKQFMTSCLNIELTKASEKLQETNAELKNFVYVASHDLREPLRKITVFADMLKNSLKDKIDHTEAENLHYMVDGAERMKKMIDGLLVYSRVSTQPHPFQKLDLNEVVSQIRKFELAVLIEEKNVEIEIPQPLPMIVGDSSQITQLMQNLIANGIKYQKKDNRPVIRITSKPAADGMVQIEVTDNGIGIKPEHHSSVFGMFKRLHGKEYEGTGIGLATCKKIVERHNGKIGLESQPGHGSTFWFTIAEVPAMAVQPIKAQ